MTPRPTTVIDDTGRTGGAGPPFVPQDPPPRVARAVAWLVLAVFAAAIAATFLVEWPDVVEVPFVLLDQASPGAATAPLHAGLTLDERDLARVRAGQRVRLLFDAYPPERYGTVGGALDPADGRSVAVPSGLGLRRTATLDATSIDVGAAREVLRAGLHGRARITVGRATLAERLFGPAR